MNFKGFHEFKLNLIIQHYSFKLDKFHEFDNDDIIFSSKQVNDPLLVNNVFKLDLDFDNQELREMLKHLQDMNLLEEFHLLRVTL